ncbi:MAG TPA: limonene-1,2-epoxide hydrolase family protein [Acidimicrobiales bacterium]
MATDPSTLVATFCEAWSRMDPDELADFFTDDGVYHNIPLEPFEGKENIRQGLAGMKALISSIRFEVHRQIAQGDVVMNERTDHIVMGDRTVALPVVGVFEVSGDKIRAWRDYFDMAQFSGAGASG